MKDWTNIPPTHGYPTSDGRPFAETQWHMQVMIDLIELITRWFDPDPMIYVSGNLFVFYERGNRRARVAPDVFVVKGVPNRMHNNFLIWEEGQGPTVVIEVTSAQTRTEDARKLHLYQRVLRVPEIFLFDPRGEYLSPPLQGHRLQEGRYVPIRFVGQRIVSVELGLELEARGTQLRLFDPMTGHMLLTANERIACYDAIEDQEKARADEGKREIKRLRRELDKLRRRSSEQ